MKSEEIGLWYVAEGLSMTPHRRRPPKKNPKFFHALIDEVVTCSKALRQQELEMICQLQRLEKYGGHKELGYRAISAFCKEALKMSSIQSRLMSEVARMTSENPAAMEELKAGTISIYEARKKYPKTPNPAKAK